MAGEGKKILVAAVFTLRPGKMIVQFPAIEIAMDHLLKPNPSSAVLGPNPRRLTKSRLIFFAERVTF
jgi:hypothetical protein